MLSMFLQIRIRAQSTHDKYQYKLHEAVAPRSKNPKLEVTAFHAGLLSVLRLLSTAGRRGWVSGGSGPG